MSRRAAPKANAAARCAKASELNDAPRLDGLTACRPSEPPTGGRAGRFGAAVRGGLLIFHASRVARSVVEN